MSASKVTLVTAQLPPRTRLALLPTPLESANRLSTAWGGPQIWVKRDDLTGFGLSGNKVRKLEFHFAAAVSAGADTVVTCGAVQSNHSRATALAAARLGFRAILLLRVPESNEQPAPVGNLLLDTLMAAVAAEEKTAGHEAWVIPEGASDALGMWGFVLAMQELADQLAAIPGKTATIWHAASSGGTTAGIGWAVDRLGLDTPVAACSIGDPVDVLRGKVQEIWSAAAAATGAREPEVPIEYIDRHIGAGYGEATTEDLALQAEATALTGMIFDPTYTGKALVGLRRDIEAGTFGKDDNIVFWHTGGGFAVFAHDFSRTGAAAVQGADSD